MIEVDNAGYNHRGGKVGLDGAFEDACNDFCEEWREWN
jgi:hypothetical protein